MDDKMKIVVGTVLVLSVVSIAMLASPIQAYVMGNSNGDMLHSQDQDRLRTHDHDNMHGGMHGEDDHRHGTDEGATDGICPMSLEEYQNEYKEETRSHGHC